MAIVPQQVLPHEADGITAPAGAGQLMGQPRAAEAGRSRKSRRNRPFSSCFRIYRAEIWARLRALQDGHTLRPCVARPGEATLWARGGRQCSRCEGLLWARQDRGE